MRSRALRVAMTYLQESKLAQTEQEEPEVLDELQLGQAINDALDTFYPAYIQQWLRNMDFREFATSMNFIVDQFHESEGPVQQLKSELSNLKNRFLKSIEDVAKSEKDSIKDSVAEHFKRNPATSVEDVEDYMRTFLIGIKNHTKREVPKWKGAV